MAGTASSSDTAAAALAPGEEPRLGLGVLGAFTAVLAWATPAVIGKGLDMSALSIVFFRGWIGVVWALGFLYLRGGRLTVPGFRASLLGGLALGIDLMCFFTAIKLTTVANATMIGALTPVVMLFAAPILFKERLRIPDILASSVAIAGLALVAFGSFGMPQWNATGDLFAVVTLAAWSVYLIASKSAQKKVGPPEFTAWVTLIASTVVTPVALLFGQGLKLPPNGLSLAALVFMAISGWLGHVLMNWSLGHIPIWVGGTCALAVPVLSTSLAVLFLDEKLVAIQALGMLIVILALSIVSLRSAQVAARPEVEPT
jgi:drug/metabolite transporter (DMT)-like permease